MDAAILGIVAGSGWASGVNAYLAVSLLSAAGRLGWMDVPPALERTDVLLGALALFVLEFFVDKIPFLDSTWDVVHTVVRPLLAVWLGIGFVEGGEGWTQAVGGVTAGGLATASHLTKATTRAAINASPEPVTNVMTSLFEDGLVIGVVWLAVAHPLVALGVVLFLLVTGAVLAVVLLRFARRGLARLRARRTGYGSPTGPP